MLVIEISPGTLDTTRGQSTMAPVGANRGGILQTGLPTDDDTRICRVGSELVRHGVKAYGHEVVSLARSVLPSRFVHPLPNRVLLFRRKGPQYGRGRRRRLGDIMPVGILLSEWPAKGNLLYLGFGEACPHHERESRVAFAGGPDGES